MAVLILFGVGLAVLGIGAVGIVRGVILLRRPPPRRRSSGILYIVAGVLLPVSCCGGPSVLFRLYHDTPPLGSYPNGVVREGMSSDEVRALLGNPHQVNDRYPQQVTWLYWLDAIGLNWFTVIFGPDGKVAHTGGS
jgi:hypothetical protein